MYQRKCVRPLGFVLLILLSAAAIAQDGAKTLTGQWQLSVESQVGVTNPTVTLTQTKNELSGTFVSKMLGTNKVTGTVKGSSFTFKFSRMAQGQMTEFVYSGTFSGNEMKGAVDARQGAAKAVFTGTRT